MKLLKKITLLLLIVFSSCIAQEDSNKIIEVQYVAHTRGTSLSITYKNDSVKYKTNSKDKTLVLSKHLQQKIQEEANKLNLKEISSLKAPSNRRFTDGALSANFTIKTNTNVFTSSDFDHENPPKELAPLYNIFKKAKKVEN
ncbi:hypothetical protein [Polaribacter sp. SA4-12]|uniref:hypothetical protein n=1 Tax=Polaribacter sp. SA4-12 TaxID=1312072 RepID=UPI000B3C8376|nr:hypothetical protein [Polaribacter sp. SA4-12]ARV15720.1 hypothetical protein BTO07_11490 [Polaribacter sp. SA4-12]